MSPDGRRSKSVLFLIKNAAVKGLEGVEKLFGFRAGSTQHEDVFIIVLLGLTGSGRSTFINTAIGGSGLVVGDISLEPVTTEVRGVAHVRDKQKFVFVDTPGLNHTNPTLMVTQVKELLLKTYSRERPDALIYLHRVSDPKVTERPLDYEDAFKLLCQDDWQTKSILATTMWGGKDMSIARKRHHQLANEYWKPALDEGSKIDSFSEQSDENAWRIINQIVHN